MPPPRAKPQKPPPPPPDFGTEPAPPAGGKVKVARRIIGVFGEYDEQPILPDRHPRLWVRAYRSPRQEERGRHDIEAQAALAGERECLRDVRRLHEAETDQNAREDLAERLEGDAVGRGPPRRAGAAEA